MEVVPSRQCGPLLKTLSPLPASLEHLKRVRPRPDEGLVEVIISDGATGDASGEERWVPDRMPVTLAQFDAWKCHWPLTFRWPEVQLHPNRVCNTHVLSIALPLRPERVGSTQSNMSIPRSTAPTRSSGLPTPIR